MDQYEKIRILGRGAFGTAVLVREKEPKSTTTGSRNQEVFRVAKQVDLAQLPAEKRKETLTEVEVLRRLDHPNVVAYLGAFLEESVLHIVMEYADGGDLAAAIRHCKDEGGAFEEDVVLKIVAQCIFGLHHMHRQRILHRDIKGQNIFLTKAGQAKLGDFGIAKIFENTLSQAKTMIGTPSYLAPEVCENMPYGSKADVWSIGVVMYELMSLQQPFQAYNIAALIIRILSAEPAPLPEDYSIDLRELTKRTLEKKPQDRPAAEEILNEQIIRQRVASKFDVTRTTGSGWRPGTGGRGSRSGSRINSRPGTRTDSRPGSRQNETRTRRRPNCADGFAVDARVDTAAQITSTGSTTASSSRTGYLDSIGTGAAGSSPSCVTSRSPATSKMESRGDRLDEFVQETRVSSAPTMKVDVTQPMAKIDYRPHSAEEQWRINNEFRQKAKANCMGEARGSSVFGTPTPMVMAPQGRVDPFSGTPVLNNEVLATSEFSFTLRKLEGEKIGAEVEAWCGNGAVRRDLLLEAIHVGGLFSRWNAAHTSQAFSIGDRLVEVNGARDPLQMLEQLKDNSLLNIRVQRDVPSPQRGRDLLTPSRGGSPAPQARSPLLRCAGSLVAEVNGGDKSPNRETMAVDRSLSRPGSSSRQSREPMRSVARQASSGAVAGQRIPSPLPGATQIRGTQLQVPSRASGGRINALMPRSRPTSGSSAHATPPAGVSGVCNEALDSFMRKVEEQQRLEEERLNLKDSQLHGGLPEEAGQTVVADDPHGREVAAKFVAKFSDEPLSLSKPLYERRKEEMNKGDSFQNLIDQIERLDSPEKRSRAPDKPCDNDESAGSSWAVAAFPSGSEWGDMPRIDLTDSWAGERTAEPTSTAFQPESPSCGETAALERVLKDDGF